MRFDSASGNSEVCSIEHGLIHQPVELGRELEVAVGIDLGHQDADQLAFGVDPEVGVIDPAPDKVPTESSVFDPFEWVTTPKP